MRGIRLATTVPLFAGAALAWWFGYAVVAVLCAMGGVLLAVLQWMTVRALQHNAAPNPPAAGGRLADPKRGPV